MSLQNISHHMHLGMWNFRSTRAASLIGAVGSAILITALVLIILHTSQISMGFLNRMTQNYIGGLSEAHITLMAGAIIGLGGLGILIRNRLKTVQLIKALENQRITIEAEPLGRRAIPSPLQLNNTKIWVGYDNSQETCEFHYFYQYKKLKKFLNTTSASESNT